MDYKVQLLSLLLLLTEASLVSSDTAIFCFPLPQGASLACESGLILVTQAYLGKIAERNSEFCNHPTVIPEYRQYDQRNMTDVVRYTCNTFGRCGLDNMRGIGRLHARYIFIEYQCTKADLPDMAFMNLYNDLTASGQEVIIQTMGYPSSDVITSDVYCNIKSNTGMPRVRLEIYDFTTNASDDTTDSYCIEFYNDIKCAEKGGMVKTVIFEPGPFMIRKMTEKPLTTRLHMVMIGIETSDGWGSRSRLPFNITCQIMDDGVSRTLPPGRQNANSSKGNVPYIVGGVLGGIAVIAVVVIIFIVVIHKKRKQDPLKNYSSNFQYNVNAAKRLGAQDGVHISGDGVYDELDDVVKNVYSNDFVTDYVSQISPYVTSQHGGTKESYSVVSNKGIFSVSDDTNNGLKTPNTKGVPQVYSVVDKTWSNQDLNALYSLPAKSTSPKQKPPIAAKPKTPKLPKRDTNLSISTIGSRRESDTSYSLDIIDNVIYKQW